MIELTDNDEHIIVTPYRDKEIVLTKVEMKEKGQRHVSWELISKCVDVFSNRVERKPIRSRWEQMTRRALHVEGPSTSYPAGVNKTESARRIVWLSGRMFRATTVKGPTDAGTRDKTASS